MSLDARKRRDILLKAVGVDRGYLLQDLEELVGGFIEARRQDREGARYRYASAPRAATAKAGQRIERAARNLQSALDAAPEMLQQLIRAKTRAQVARTVHGTDVDAGLFDGVLYVLATVAGELSTVAKGKPAAKRGPKSDPLREALEAGVGAVLKRHGDEPSGHETGLFAHVLAAVLEAAEARELPEGDPRPRLRKAARRAKRG